jgi:cellulose synthase/poly-beta-1,6-N-acetylglucosamine synthase-like glycosyltransferase
LQFFVIFFLVFVGIQVLFLIVFLTAFRRRKVEHEHPGVPVSVVVCAHDELENLRELVPLLLSQDYPEYEVIIVNDRSNDGTFDFLREWAEKDKRLRMVDVQSTPERVNGKKYGLTLGIKAASYEWVLLTDADCRPNSEQWIRRMSHHFTDSSDFVLGFSPYRKGAGLLNLFIRFETVLTAIQYFALGWLGNPYMGVGRNLAYRKSLFINKKGFNQFLHVQGGDDDLFVNLHARGSNTRLELGADSQVQSIPETSWRAFFRQKVRHLSVGKRYRFSHRILLGLFTSSWLLTWLSVIVLIAGCGLNVADTGLPESVPVEIYLVSGAFALRLILLLLLFRVMKRQASVRLSLWALPVLDFIYTFYYLSTGLVALTSKTIRWRN